MPKPIPSFLKLHSSGPDDLVAPPPLDLPGWEPLSDAFQELTGWHLHYWAADALAENLDPLWSAPVDPGDGTAPGLLTIDLGQARNVASLASRAPLESAERLADCLAGLLGQLVSARQSLWRREAELAAGVPVTLHPEDPHHLAVRLEAILRAGAQSLGCQSAALYLLDEATTELKLRGSWGLPFDRLSQPARPLKSALADLEALLGHAVCLEKDSMFRPWNVPEPCQAAICVPVSSPSMPLGTLWFFSSDSREFTNEESNLAEVIAGRLASELDRAVLLSDRLQSAPLQRQIEAAREFQLNQLPQVPPPLPGWDVAGWTCQSGPVGGAFHDWRILPDGRLLLAVGDACDGGVPAALAASGLRGALAAAAADPQVCTSPDKLLARLDSVLQSTAAGDQWAGILLALLDLATGDLQLASAGRPTPLLIAPSGVTRLLSPSDPLGLARPDFCRAATVCLAPGESLLLFTRGFSESGDERGRPLDESALGAALARTASSPGNAQPSANALLATLCDRYDAHAIPAQALDRAALALRRQP